MKIKSINIKKFRQLENVFEENIGLINELYGSNGSGKTSFISFITWLLYGETLDYGKNDEMNIDSYKPYDTIGGEIILSDGIEEVSLVREFGIDDKGKKTNNFYINGRKVSKQDEYYNQVNDCFKVFVNVKIKNFNLQRALSDPYYLPNNETQFRELISALLSDVDTYSVLFEDDKYRKIQNDFGKQGNDYDKCKEFYRQQLTEIEKNLLYTNSFLNEYKNINFNEQEYNNLLKELDDTRKETVSTNQELEDIYKEIQDLTTQLLTSQNNDIVNRPISKEEKEYKEIRDKYNNLINEYEALKQKEYNIASAKKIVENKLSYLQIELEQEKAKTFKEIKCPNCDTMLNEDDYKEFNKNKVAKVKELKEKISVSEKEKETYKIQDNDLLDKLDAMEQTLDKYLNDLNALKSIFANKPIEYSSEETKALKSQINELQEKYNSMREQEQQNRVEFVKKQNEKMNSIQEKLNVLNENRIKLSSLSTHKENKKVLLENKATYELRLSLLEEYKRDEIQLIKNATTKIFGNDFDFEMLVKNKSNDNYKKVCYASIDGLEHNKSNTAKYLKLSIMLLEKLKAYIGICDFPIIFDIADNIGKTARNEIFDLIKNSQIFYTRISDEDNVERKLNVIKGE